MERSTNFQYEPLDQSRNLIRVLDLKPGRFHDAFQCNLRTVSLEGRPTYQALSYTWGKAAATPATAAPILIDIGNTTSHSITITHNLDEALRHIRSERDTKTLWVDAICIDQRNHVEKADQVRKMLEVYRSADQVLVWLGPKAQDSDLAIDLIHRIPTVDFDRLRSGLTDTDQREWRALKDLYRRPWWRRAWIVQESSIATKEPLIGCGNRWLAWRVYERAYTCIVDQLMHPDFLLPRLIIHTNVQRVFAMRRRVLRVGTDISIMTVLREVQWFEATDPRDKVFAVYGLIADSFKDCITLDYKRSVIDVYTSLSQHLVNLDLNQLLVRTSSTMPGLPSWVSDWSSSDIRLGDPWKPGVYNAGGLRLSSPSFLRPGGQAFLHGAVLGTILMRDDSPPLEEDSTLEDLLRTVGNFERTLQRAQERYPDNQILQMQRAVGNDGFVRCLVGDTDMNGEIFDFIAGESTPVPRAPGDFSDIMQVLQGRTNVPAAYHPRLPAQERRDKYTHRLKRALRSSLPRKTFFITSGGFLGLATHNVQVGDYIAVIFGLQMPVIIRPVDASGTASKLIGPAYIHLIMDGLALGFEQVEAAKNRQDDGKYNICLV